MISPLQYRSSNNEQLPQEEPGGICYFVNTKTGEVMPGDFNPQASFGAQLSGSRNISQQTRIEAFTASAQPFRDRALQEGGALINSGINSVVMMAINRTDIWVDVAHAVNQVLSSVGRSNIQVGRSEVFAFSKVGMGQGLGTVRGAMSLYPKARVAARQAVSSSLSAGKYLSGNLLGSTLIFATIGFGVSLYNNFDHWNENRLSHFQLLGNIASDTVGAVASAYATAAISLYAGAFAMLVGGFPALLGAAVLGFAVGMGVNAAIDFLAKAIGLETEVAEEKNKLIIPFQDIPSPKEPTEPQVEPQKLHVDQSKYQRVCGFSQSELRLAASVLTNTSN